MHQDALGIVVARHGLGRELSMASREPTPLALPERYPQVLVVFALTYSYSWLVWGIGIAKNGGFGFLLAGGFGPLLAALGRSATARGETGLLALLRRFLVWRVSVRWYVVVLLWVAGIRLLAIALHVALGGDFRVSGGLVAKVPALFLVGLIAPLLEEPGWRGFALPRMLSRHSAITAAISVGLLWGIWHVPLFWFPGISYSSLRAQVGWPTAIGSFLASVTALSILFTLVYLKTKGSLLMAVLFHDAVNTSADLFAAPYARAGVLRPFFLSALLLVLTAVVVVGSGGLKGSEQVQAHS